MNKVVLIFGLVIGLVFCANIGFMVYWMYHNPDLKSSEIVGYTVMVLVFSLSFFGTRNYRNKYLDGYITFGKAFKTGALIALVGSTIYVVAWLFSYYLFVPNFMDVYTDYVLKNCAVDDLAAKTKEMADFNEMYKNPFFVILITYSEVLPIGLIVALISALILKRKQKTQSNLLSI
jgi:pheromone shutdown protein TraB